MTNIDNFKNFVKKNPNLITYVRNSSMSWQKFYELYDLYGEDENIWKEYINKKENQEIKKISNNSTSSSFNISNILEIAKNIDTNRLQEGITSMQKAISLFSDMLVKEKSETKNYTPRPIYRKFDD